MAKPPLRAASSRFARGPLDPQTLVAAARKGECPAVLVITGRDYFTRDAVLSELKQALVPEGFEAFNYETLSGEAVSGGDLVNRAEMLPMFPMHPGGVGRRLIVIRRADKIKERDAEVLGRYAGAPAATTCLVFVSEVGKAPILTALKKTASALDLPAPRDYQLARWLQGQASRTRVPLDPEAARMLADLSGEDHVAAMSYLTRASLAAKGRVTRAAIEDMMAQAKDTNPFHLSDAVLAREPARAVRIMRDLFDAGGTSYMILGMLEGQLRRFLQMRAKMAGGRPAREVVQETSPTLPPDVRARLTRQLESFDEPRLIEAFRLARRADRAVKSHGSGAEQAHMESLIWRIASL